MMRGQKSGDWPSIIGLVYDEIARDERSGVKRSVVTGLGTRLQVPRQGKDYEGYAGQTLLAIDDLDMGGQSLVLDNVVENGAQKVIVLATGGSQYVEPEFLALCLVPRIKTLVGRDDKAHVALFHKLQHVLLHHLHGAPRSLIFRCIHFGR